MNTIHDGRSLGKDNAEIAFVANTGDTSRYAYNHVLEDETDFNLEMDISFGLSERFDLGLKANLSGTGSLNGKYQFFGDKQSILASSAGLEMGANLFEFFTGTYLTYAAFLSYNSIHFSDKFCLFVNPKYVYSRHSTTDWPGKLPDDEKIVDIYKAGLISYGFLIGKEFRVGMEITQDPNSSKQLQQIGLSLSYVFGANEKSEKK